MCRRVINTDQYCSMVAARHRVNYMKRKEKNDPSVIASGRTLCLDNIMVSPGGSPASSS